MARKINKKLFVRRRPCQFCINNQEYIDYKDQELLQNYINQHGKILSSRITGCCSRHQRTLATAIKRSRIVAILPFIGSGKVK
ncbi:30S ribosomal protein S18 [Mycoplasma miroungirhinis]|uniref:Small ribosomal subunit protein bS18 n=1 Tax=Mycoplasma miroungirhinis TaxID=754516 RepID=A0A6M4JBM7_9MOLU|nr:30S ribosomal protein S18 [Mycoplasma miroungirhinis]QJR44413.1 30S ribosomal protein S18 [Mycoplasma miroungirhinis]